MTGYINTILLFIIIGILIAILFKKKDSSINQEKKLFDIGMLLKETFNHFESKLLSYEKLIVSKLESHNELQASKSLNVPDEATIRELDDIMLRELFEIKEIPATEITLHNKESGITKSSQYFQVLGEFIKNSGNLKLTGTAYKICFNPNVEHGLRNGTFQLMNKLNGYKQLTAINSTTGKIVGNGWIEQVRADRLLAISTIAWQAMAMITAQKFLSDINKTMKEVKASIDYLIRLNDAEIAGKLNGWQCYIKQAAERLAGNINETERQSIAIQLEEIYRLSIQEYFASEDRLKYNIKNLNNTMKNNKANKESAKRVGKECDEVYKEAGRLLAFARINVVDLIVMNMRLDFQPEIMLNSNHTILKESFEEVLDMLDESLKIAETMPAGFWDSVLRLDSIPYILFGSLFDLFEKSEYDADKDRENMKTKIHSLSSNLKKQQANQLKLISEVQNRLRKSQELYFMIDKNGQIQQGERVDTY